MLNRQHRTFNSPVLDVVHFLFLEERFEFVHYLAILSASARLQPDILYLHVVREPTANYWWRLAEPLVRLERVEAATEGFRPERMHERGGILLDLDLLILKPFDTLPPDQPEELFSPFAAQDRSLFQLMTSEQIERFRHERLAKSFTVRLWRDIWAPYHLDLSSPDIALERSTLFASLVREILEEAAPHVLEPSPTRSSQQESELWAAQVDALAREAVPLDWEAVKATYEACCRDAPDLALPYYRLSCLERKKKNFEVAFEHALRARELPKPKTHSSLPFPDLYTWVAEDELAICAHWVGREVESFERCTRLLIGTELPDSEWDRVTSNRDFAADRVKKSRESYPDAVVSTIQWWSKTPSSRADVTLTLTACKRPELLATTVNSFLHCCEDIYRIAHWVCIDDGSSQEDLARFREMYPFFELIVKERADKGHAHSMNRLREEVTTPYWLHMEDDWHFLARQPYISLATEILDEFDEIAQVLFNRNYGETLACRRHWGGIDKRTSGGHRFRLHQYFPDPQSIQDYQSALPPGALHHAHWPHFSFRPSLMRTKDILEIGPFEPEADFFEREFALRYTSSGLKSASLDVVNALHIGKLTWETGENAYTLNDETQFSGDSTGW